MKSLYQKLNESRTGDLFQTIADCIKDKNNITDADIKKVISSVKSSFGNILSDEEAKFLAQEVAENWSELFENK